MWRGRRRQPDHLDAEVPASSASPGRARPRSPSVACGSPESPRDAVLGETEIERAPWPGRTQVPPDAVTIFQDPHPSLSPRMRVSAPLTEPDVIDGIGRGQQHPVPSAQHGGTPRAGGQRLPTRAVRRAGTACRDRPARYARPRLIVADERRQAWTSRRPARSSTCCKSSATKQHRLPGDRRHALNVVGYLADRIAVMYLGRVVETGRPSRPTMRRCIPTPGRSSRRSPTRTPEEAPASRPWP